MKKGKITRNKIVREIINDTFFTIFSHLSSFIFLLTLLTNDFNISLNKNPPSRGIIGRTLNKPTRRFSQKIQYKAVVIIQNKLVGKTPIGPVIVYESVNGDAIGL